MVALADLRRGARDAPPPLPLGVQILSISCRFLENLAKSYVDAPPLEGWRPHLGEILDPPLGGVGAQEIFKFSTPSGTGTRGLLPRSYRGPLLGYLFLTMDRVLKCFSNIN